MKNVTFGVASQPAGGEPAFPFIVKLPLDTSRIDPEADKPLVTKCWFVHVFLLLLNELISKPIISRSPNFAIEHGVGNFSFH